MAFGAEQKSRSRIDDNAQRSNDHHKPSRYLDGLRKPMNGFPNYRAHTKHNDKGIDERS